MRHIRMIRSLVVSFLLFLMLSQISYAYLDLGSGSYLFQLAIASILGGMYIIKLFWNKIKSFFINIFARGKNE